MSRYALVFSKKGYIRYISHLDMLRLFKRAFRRAGIRLAYSHGFNPHPKMGFAQPLSLGYEASREMLEFETECRYPEEDIRIALNDILPEGIRVNGVAILPDKGKSLAACVNSAVYRISFPVPYYAKEYAALTDAFLSQDEILVEKKQKKRKTTHMVNIRGKIREMIPVPDENERLVIVLNCDCGSGSNLSPELLLQAYLHYIGSSVLRHEIDVSRESLSLSVDYSFRWM